MSTEQIVIDKSWTLFLDRDGVINMRLHNDYVKSPAEFRFLPGVVEAISRMSSLFSRIIVVTNQQGIAKGIYSHEDLASIHDLMKKTIEQGGGRIDAIFYAHHLASEHSPMRKPGIGMALEAKKLFPEIDFKRCIMVGDTESDMQFARSAGMKAVYCNPEGKSALADLQVDSLAGFASYISGSKA